MNQADAYIKELKKRSTALYNQNGFIERLMMPLMELIPHDAASVNEAEDVGFSIHGINYGFPLEFMIESFNQDTKVFHRFDNRSKFRTKKEYSTIQISEIPESSEVRKASELLHSKHGFASSLTTLFFSSTGKMLGIYTLGRKSATPFTKQEKNLFHIAAPYIFYAFRKYKKLIDINFHNSYSMERQVFGIVVADNNNIISWQNSVAEKLLKNKYGRIQKRLPACLEKASKDLMNIAANRNNQGLVSIDIFNSCSYGQVLCFRYDIFGSMFLPVDGEGLVCIIDTKHIEKTILSSLTRREKEVLRFLAEGMSDKEISSALEISEKTIQTYTNKLFRKLNVSNRTGAAVEAVKLKII